MEDVYRLIVKDGLASHGESWVVCDTSWYEKMVLVYLIWTSNIKQPMFITFKV